MSFLRQIFEALRDCYAAQPYRWWSDDPVEVIVGAVLVQGSTWKSVDKVLDVMYPQGFMEFPILAQLPDEELADVIRPVGFQTKKAVRLKALAKLFLEQCGGQIERFFARDVETVRQDLLSVPGIGSATADNIMLYAGNMPVYMVDIFMVRLMRRHGFVSPTANKEEIQKLIFRELTPDEEPHGAALFKKMQEYVVRVGRNFCSKTKPDCEQCPLRSFLPEEQSAEYNNQKSIPVKKHEPATFLPKQPVPQVPPVSVPELSDSEQTVFDLVGNEPASIDTVAEAARLPIHIVRASIVMLQMKKLVKQIEGNNVVRT